MALYAFLLVWGAVLGSALLLIVCAAIALVQHGRDREFARLERWFKESR